MASKDKWVCESCDKEFSNKRDAENHEKTCIAWLWTDDFWAYFLPSINFILGIALIFLDVYIDIFLGGSESWLSIVGVMLCFLAFIRIVVLVIDRNFRNK